MVAFIIFGLAIGYLTFFFTSFINPLVMLQKASQHILEHVELRKGQTLGATIEDLLRQTSTQETLADILTPLQQNRDLLSSLVFYVSDPGGSVWKAVDLTAGPGAESFVPDLGTSAALNSLVRPDQDRDTRPLIRQRDEVTLLMDITGDTDAGRYALGFTFRRMVFSSYLRENMTQFIIFAVFVGLFSLILARMFSRRISRPIIRLTKKAATIAEGDLTQRFKIRRRDELGSLANSLNLMADEIEKRMKETEKQLTTMRTMNKIDKAVLSSTSRNDLLDRVMGFISGQFAESNTILALRNEEKGGFEITSFTPGLTRGILRDLPLLSDNDFSDELKSRIPQVFQTSDPKDEVLRIYKDITGHYSSVKTLLNVPIFRGGVHTGSIIMTKPGRIPYGSDETAFIGMLADQVGVALQSVREVENREALNLGVLRALTKTIDAKSPWTAGHSERVAMHAESIGSAINMNEEDLRELAISALLHDVGKIGVAEDILNKPGRLTDGEFAAIREHPDRGAHILEDIPEYAHILEGVRFHHERWDGSGYPEKRSREDIPFFGRIIAVADVYDAVTYDRPYRSGMSINEAVEFMLKGKETMFDPDITDLFLTVLAREKKNNESLLFP